MSVKIKSVEYLNFMIGSYHSEYRHFIFEDNFFTYRETQFEKVTLISPIETLENDFYLKLLEILNKSHFTIWQKVYENENIIDGTEWSLEVKYNKRKTSKISYGYNLFPFIIQKERTHKIINCEKDLKRLMKIFNQIINKKNYFY